MLFACPHAHASPLSTFSDDAIKPLIVQAIKQGTTCRAENQTIVCEWIHQRLEQDRVRAIYINLSNVRCKPIANQPKRWQCKGFKAIYDFNIRTNRSDNVLEKEVFTLEIEL